MGFISYAPPALDVFHVGIVSGESSRPVRAWHDIQIGNRSLHSFAAFHERDENRRTQIPLTLRFSLALYPMRKSLSRGVMLFNRLEPAYPFRSAPNPKIGFVHTDIQEQFSAKSEVAWRHSQTLYFAVERSIVASLEHLYVVNTRAVQFYKNRYPQIRDRISFLPTWVDEGMFSPLEGSALGVRDDISKKYAIPTKGKWILFVGRFQKVKDPLLLIKTFERHIARTNEHAVLILVGEGNMKGRMTSLAKELGVSDRLHFLTFLPQQELRRFYQACDVLLLTSMFEGMPRTALEALGCGLPVVSTPSGDIERVLSTGKSGELVSARDPDALAMGLARVLERSKSSWLSDCLTAIRPYRPQAVLEDVYQRCIALAGKASEGRREEM